MSRILLVDDDASTRRQLGAALRESGHEVMTASSGEAAIARLPEADVEVIVTDLKMGRVGGMEVLHAARSQRPDVPVIVLTGHGSIDAAVQAMRQGAADFLTKPVDLDRLDLVLEKAAHSRALMTENTRLRRELAGAKAGRPFIGRSPPILALLADIDRVAATSATVLILGESGTGKEIIAERIHRLSQRSDGPLVRVNCAALAEGVFESELFGHEKGAYTGAVRSRQGRFEAANRGTLFLDEIGDLSIAAQLKLLRVLQERTIERVGSTVSVPVDVRLVAATNRDLQAAVLDGSFREELFYRLNVVVLRLPPLRERPGDVAVLCEAFIEEFAGRHGRPVHGLSEAARRRMDTHPWPGNVRELRNAIEAMVIRAQGGVIEEADIAAWLAVDHDRGEMTMPLGRSLDELELAYIERTLAAVGGNKTHAARILGIGAKTLHRKLKRGG